MTPQSQPNAQMNPHYMKKGPIDNSAPLGNPNFNSNSRGQFQMKKDVNGNTRGDFRAKKSFGNQQQPNIHQSAPNVPKNPSFNVPVNNHSQNSNNFRQNQSYHPYRR